MAGSTSLPDQVAGGARGDGQEAQATVEVLVDTTCPFCVDGFVALPAVRYHRGSALESVLAHVDVVNARCAICNAQEARESATWLPAYAALTVVALRRPLRLVEFVLLSSLRRGPEKIETHDRAYRHALNALVVAGFATCTSQRRGYARRPVTWMTLTAAGVALADKLCVSR